MGEIYVHLSGIDNAADRIKDISGRLDQVRNRFDALSRSIDWELKSKSSIIRAIDALNKQMDEAAATLDKHYSYLLNAKNVYIEADNGKAVKGADLTADPFETSNGNGGGVTTPNSYDNSKKDVPTGGSGGSSSGSSSEPVSASSFEEQVENFIKKLGEKGIMEYFKGYGKYHTGSSILSSIFGAGFKLKSYYDSYKTGISCKSAFIVDTIGTGISAITSWGSGIFMFDDILKKAKNLTPVVKTAGFRQVCEYAPIINIPFKFAKTAFESYQTYSADGNFSMLDLSETMIDASCSGLSAVVSSAYKLYTGGSSIITGILTGGALTFDAANSAFKLDKIASDSIKNWSINAGKRYNENKGKLTLENVVYKGLYEIGHGASNIIDGAGNIINSAGQVVNKASEGIGNAYKTVSSWFKF